jgi:hypothetical protein
VFVTVLEQGSSLETNSRSASQEVPRLLWNPEIHYFVHKWNPPPIPILRQVNSGIFFPSCFSKNHLSTHIIFLTMCTSPKWYLQVFRLKFCKQFSCRPCVLHVPPILSSLIWSYLYPVKSTNYPPLYTNGKRLKKFLNDWMKENSEVGLVIEIAHFNWPSNRYHIRSHNQKKTGLISAAARTWSNQRQTLHTDYAVDKILFF